MSASLPLVSVVIPAYNAAWCVERAIRSVLGQDYPHVEIIVVDDGSTDETPRILGRYENQVRVIRKENGGLSSARNAGIAAARGDYVAFLDADDFWFPQKLSRQMSLMAADPALGFSSTAAIVVTEGGTPLSVWRCPEEGPCLTTVIFSRLSAVPGSGSGVVVQRRLFDRVGLFDERLRSVEDVDMWLRLSSVTAYACLDEPLVVVVRHGSGMSRNGKVMREATLAVLRKNRGLLPRQLRGGFWRASCAAALADAAKWEYRQGKTAQALALLMRGLSLSPVKRGRLLAGLAVAMARGEAL
ncbi:MAG: glycosyltransferase family 2 protein [Desulfacinum sp.]|jgi:glycosyltransferase involved in cell wall biosynthesis|nr:glycosyltransferase family 2 protein [Desulfacinum sp.]MBZ4658469.1 glycosyl transferase family 2 [Desulfacinum sp.]